MKLKKFVRKTFYIIILGISIILNFLLFGLLISYRTTDKEETKSSPVIDCYPEVYNNISGTYTERHINFGAITLFEEESSSINFSTDSQKESKENTSKIDTETAKIPIFILKEK